MRTVIAGSRGCKKENAMVAFSACPWIGFVTTVVSGGAKGADQYGEEWAKSKNLSIALYLADWKTYGRRAGPIRNKQMAENAEGLIAIWDGVSRGTRGMIEYAMELGLRVFVFDYTKRIFIDYPASGKIASYWEESEERAAIKEFGGNILRSEAEFQAGLDVVKLYIDGASLPPRLL